MKKESLPWKKCKEDRRPDSKPDGNILERDKRNDGPRGKRGQDKGRRITRAV